MKVTELTLEEREQLRMIFGNSVLVSALRKVFRERSEYWRRMGRSEATSNEPRPSLLVQYASREAESDFAMGVIEGGTKG